MRILPQVNSRGPTRTRPSIKLIQKQSCVEGFLVGMRNTWSGCGFLDEIRKYAGKLWELGASHKSARVEKSLIPFGWLLRGCRGRSHARILTQTILYTVKRCEGAGNPGLFLIKTRSQTVNKVRGSISCVNIKVGPTKLNSIGYEKIQ